MKPEERKMLIALLVMYIIVFIGAGAAIGYLLTAKRFTLELIAIIIGLAAFVGIWLVPKCYKMYADVSENKVLEGRAKVTEVKVRMSSGYDCYIKLDTMGKDEINLQAKDRNAMVIGDLIAYRITPRSKMLVGFEKLKP